MKEKRRKENKVNTIKEIINDHKQYSKQIGKLAKSDLIKTYRGAALGWAWAIIKPTVTIFVYWFAFTIGLRATKTVSGNYPFFLWLIAGIVPWFYMNDMISAGTDCIRKYSYLVTKMKFPVSTIPTFVSISKMIVEVLLLSIVFIIFLMFGFKPDIYYLQIFFYLLLAFAFFTGWGLFASPIGAMSKDFSNLVKSFITAIFWLSGILWDAESIKILWLKKLLRLNPITYLCTGFRNCFVYKVWFWEQPKRLLYFLIALAIMWALGIWSYKKFRKEIPDVL